MTQRSAHLVALAALLCLSLASGGLCAWGCASSDPRAQVALRFAQVPAPDLDLLEQLLHQRVNQVRRAHGLGELAWDEQLLQIARAYSVRMRRADQLTHTLHGSSLSGRYESADYACKIRVMGTNRSLIGGENLALIPQIPQIVLVSDGSEYPQSVRTMTELVDATVDGWMNSPGHRENLLTPQWIRQGIGVVIDREHRLWITQNFC